jgi:hypothetical protein
MFKKGNDITHLKLSNEIIQRDIRFKSRQLLGDMSVL